MRNLWLQIKNFFQNLWYGIRSLRHLRRSQLPQVIENFSRKEIYTLLATLLVTIITGGFLIIYAFSDKGPGPHYGGELVEGLVGQPQFINPVLALNSGVDTDISRVVYAQILKFDSAGQLQPDLAESLPEISADQKNYTLHLKPNLKWQDGKPLNADDVLFTIQTIQNADFESPLRPNWSRVKVEKKDDLTLTFQLREVSVSFMNNFALGIFPKHSWEGLNPRNFRLSDLNLKPVGSGPYSVREIKKTSDGVIKSITLRANANYHQGQPYISTLTFRFYDDYESLINAYQGKEIQSLGYVPFDKTAFLTENDRMNQYRVNLPQYQAVFFNLSKNPVLAEKAVRQALWLATDRKQLIDEVYNGNAAPAFGPILPGSLGYNENLEKSAHYDLAEAAALLDKAGWVLDPNTNIRTNAKSKKSLEFNLVLSGNLVLNVKTGQVLESQWEKLGAKVNLVVVGPAELENQYIRPRSFDALLFSENVGADPDPFPFWHGTQIHDPGLNLSGFVNTEADKLLTEARQTSDSAVRARNYIRFEEIINSELPAIFLARSLYIYNVPKKVSGIDLHYIVQPADRFQDLNHWYFRK
ncbi:MAG: peptide ABC transporter substrate-binding protein [Candidatus Doudnabacteria bacterium]|nr:peptide ABC transporter substrate-binding protein [Candidatus Doudnabacteria bacterium]